MNSSFCLIIYQSNKELQLFIVIVDFDAYKGELKSSNTSLSNASIFWCFWWAKACFLAISFSLAKFSSSSSPRSKFFLFSLGRMNLMLQYKKINDNSGILYLLNTYHIIYKVLFYINKLLLGLKSFLVCVFVCFKRFKNGISRYFFVGMWYSSNTSFRIKIKVILILIAIDNIIDSMITFTQHQNRKGTII